MKTNEELNALKQEFETMNKKLRELTEEELAQVTGGGTDFTYDDIMQYINNGDDFWARELFNLIQYSLTPLEAYTIRMTFWAKFGYPIDKIGGGHEKKQKCFEE